MLYIFSLLRPRLSILLLSFALIVCFAGELRAQSALDGFDPNANGAVNVVIVQPDGKIIIGGDFTTLSPNGGPAVTRNRIARLNTDGTLDTAFNPNANVNVNAIALQADGKILAGGDFTNIGGQPRNRIARLDATTGLADSFDPNANGSVSTIAVQADGSILAAGGFSNIGGQPRNRIARLDATTGLADSFDPNANNIINSIAVQADGKILVVGFFSSIGGQTRTQIARLDATTGLADSWNPSASGGIDVYTIAVQADGKILAGGDFFTIGGQTRNGIARLDAVTGSADSFNPNANNTVSTITVQPDGKILAAGIFTNIGGQTRNRIARLDATTGLADSFNPNADNGVTAIAVQLDGKILAGGAFTTFTPNGGALRTRNRIARLETDGRLDQTLNLNIIGTTVYATAVQPDGKILIGGNFAAVLGVTRSNIARLNPDGTLDTAFNSGADNDVYAIAVQADGKILVGGAFTNIGGQARNHIARLDASTASADSFDPNSSGAVFSIAVQTDGKILSGGDFVSIGGQPRNYIARLDPTTGSADLFDPNASFRVDSIAVQADGKILAGGHFTSIGGQTRLRIARLDAVSGLADSFDPNANHFVVNSITVQPDGNILAGGDFTSIGGQARNHIARLDAATGLADSFDPNANGNVLSIAVQADGKILAGGEFSGANSIGGQTRNYIARLDATTGAADSFDPNANSAGFGINSIAVRADGKILVGGDFTSIGGQARKYFARLNNDTVALQNLAVTQPAVTWTRGGSSPQFTRVTFEDSTDNVSYNFLGNGTVAGSNWILAGLNLSTGQNLYIRARGYYRGGYANSSESITETVRNAFVVAVPMVTGTVTYGNAIGAPTPRFISNVLMSGAGSLPVSVFTAGLGPTAGQYSLTGFGAGAYTITPSKTGGVNNITSFDAAKIAQHVAGTSLLSGNQLIAADTSGNGSINSFDAAQIAKYVTSSPPYGITGQWRFYVSNPPFPLPTPPATPYPSSRTYASVTGSIAGENYVGLLIGDVSGNWNNTGARTVGGRAAQVDGNASRKSEAFPLGDGQSQGMQGPERGIAVDLPNLSAPLEKEIVVPVNVQGVADKGIISYEFDLRYDPTVIQLQADPVDVAGTVSRGLSVVTNAEEPGLLRVVLYGAMPINVDGVLLNLRFTAIGKTGSISPLTWERIMFNEGDPRTTATDGQIELVSSER